MPCRNIRQSMCSFNGEDAEDFHDDEVSRSAAPSWITNDQAALRLREVQLQVPQAQRTELQSVQTEKSTEPK